MFTKIQKRHLFSNPNFLWNLASVYIIFIIFFSTALYSQDENIPQKNEPTIHLFSIASGIGVFSFKDKGLPVFLSSTYHFSPLISAGFYTAYFQFNETITSNNFQGNSTYFEEHWKRKQYQIGLQGELHLPKSVIKQVNFYLVAVAGFNFIENRLENDVQPQSQQKTKEILLFVDFAADYFFTEQLGLHARIGYSKAPFFIGITYSW